MYAGFWKRWVSFIIDIIIVNTFTSILMNFGMVAMVKKDNDPSAILFIALAATLLNWAVYILYWAIFESSSLQATPGKMALGIKVTDMNGEKLTFLRSLSRNAAKIVTGFTLNVGYVMAGFTVQKQALHDKMTDCLVINKTATAEELVPLPKAPVWKVALAILGGFAPFIILAVSILLFAAVIASAIMGSGMSPSDFAKNMPKSGYTQTIDNTNDTQYLGWEEDSAQ